MEEMNQIQVCSVFLNKPVQEVKGAFKVAFRSRTSVRSHLQQRASGEPPEGGPT